MANHKFTVVGVDASYVKHFTTSYLILGPGQTTNVLIKEDQPPAIYYMTARTYANGQGAPLDNTITTDITKYKTTFFSSNYVKSKLVFPSLLVYNDTSTTIAFRTKLRSLIKVELPTEIDENPFITVKMGPNNFPIGVQSRNCQGPNGTQFTTSMNNVSFMLPSKFSLLQSNHKGIRGVLSTNFPAVPPINLIILVT
ncbi:Laccase-5 [Capsicum annuum]|nr:Laccase-5 [Capsicum annuum]